MTERLTQGEALVGGLEVEDHANVKSLSVETDATISGNAAVEGIISDVDAIDFDVTATATGAVGRLHWNDTDGTLDLGMKGGNVTQQVGLEQLMLVKHADNAGLASGKIVYFVGSDGANKTVRYASASAEATSVNTLGMITETVTGGNKAFCTTFGLVRNINTNGLDEGKVVWLDTAAGGMTTTKPVAPVQLVQVGFCIRKSATVGSVFVSVQNGYELEELHNVLITDPQDGDVLTYSASAGLWRNQQP